MSRLRGALLLAALAGAAQAGELRLQVSDAGDHAVEHAAVWLKPLHGTVPPAPLPMPHAVIDQQSRMFRPLVTVLRTDTPVDFPNSDNIRHSVYSFSPARTFTLKLYSRRPSEPVVFDKEGIITLGCNIHDQMIAWIVAVDTPWYAQSGAGGAAVIGGVPEGEYQLSAWHPGMQGDPVAREVRVGAGAASESVRLDARPVASLLPDTEGRPQGTDAR